MSSRVKVNQNFVHILNIVFNLGFYGGLCLCFSSALYSSVNTFIVCKEHYSVPLGLFVWWSIYAKGVLGKQMCLFMLEILKAKRIHLSLIYS